MIPVKLTIKGLYSYREEQVIDFSRLKEGQIFGIFGGVGSGKSSVLEAISFALYDQSERLNQRDKRNYNMMNLKSDELLIDFVFQAQEEQYRFKVSASRKKNKDEVNPFQKDTYILEGGQWVAKELMAEDILGLSYENFQRTIIIPQGKFQEFLQLTDGERVRMMKEIFHLEKFDLTEKVASLISKNNLKKENLEGMFSSVAQVDEELIREKESKLAEISDRLKNISIKLEEKQHKEKELERLRNLFKQLESELLILEGHKKMEPVFSGRQQELDKYERYIRIFKQEIDLNKHLSVEEAELHKKLEESRAKISSLQEVLKIDENEFNALKVEFDKRDHYQKQADEYLKLIQVKRLGEKCRALKIQKETELKSVEVFGSQVKKWEEKEADGIKKLKEVRNKLLDTSLELAIISWLEEKRGYDRRLQELHSRKKMYEQKLKDCDHEVTVLKEELLLALPEFSDFSRVNSDIAKAVSEFKKKLETAKEDVQKTLESLAAHVKLEEFSRQLKDGMPCPLCGAKDHPAPLNSEANLEKLKELERERNAISFSLQAINGIESRLLVMCSTKDANVQVCQEIESQLSELKRIAHQHIENFKWKHLVSSDESAITEFLKDNAELRVLDKKIVDGIEAVRSRQAEARSKREEAERAHIATERMLSTIEAEQKVLITQISNTGIEEKISVGELLELSNELLMKIEQVTSRFRKVEENLLEKRKQYDQLIGQIEAIGQNLASVREKISQNLQSLNKKLKEVHASSLREVEKVLDSGIDAEKERSAIQLFREQLVAAAERVKNLKDQVTGIQFDENELLRVVAEVNQLKELMTELQKQTGALGIEIKGLKEQFEQKNKLEAELNLVNQRAENLRLLANMFRGNGFVNFVSTQYLINLCNAANERFYKLTRQQLRLEVSENNDFQVRDFLNNGKLRSVKTLSGGQTFQASLCLALALADSVQQLNKSKQNFFFLDEGFGTLDKESLRPVFDTLKALRKENRVVGIISHVEELQQEIDVFLKVTNDPESGSMVKGSWEI